MPRLDIKISVQTADLYDDAGNLVRSYRVSTSRKRGRPAREHVFVRRRPTGESYTAERAQQFPMRGWILTRILWLPGCEVGGKPVKQREYHAPLNIHSRQSRQRGDGQAWVDWMYIH